MSEHPPHREEARFVIRIELSAEFADEYEGDDDGYAWLERWRSRAQPRVVRAIFAALREEAGFDAIPSARGVDPEGEIEIRVRLKTGTSATDTQGSLRGRPGERDGV